MGPAVLNKIWFNKSNNMSETKAPFLLTCMMCFSSSLQVRLNALDEQWQFLVNKSAEKSQKLKEANKQQNFNTGIKDFDFWLSEVR